MLARLARELPHGDGFIFEPKWDGFRCLVFRSGDDVDLRSRNHRPFSRYFPEIVDGVRSLAAEGLVLDGEIVAGLPNGLDFAALLARLHPSASRVERLRRESPVSFVAFDLIAVGAEDLRSLPFEERRSRLTGLLQSASPPILLTPATTDRDIADGWLERFQGAGIDGVVAKHRGLPYQPGKRAMVKVKHERTADCVVAGFRRLTDRPLLGSLLLGLYDDAGGHLGTELRHVGVASSFTDVDRHRLLDQVSPLTAALEGHPWEHGFGIGRSPVGRLKGAAGRWAPDMERDWIPLRPELVCEVAYDQLDDGRFRHPARFCRWRPDRDPRSCSFTQLEVSPPGLREILSLT